MCTARISMTMLLLVPAALGAEEVQFGARTNLGWSDNVFHVPEEDEEDPTSDFSARVTPFVAVIDPDGNLTWDLRYQPTYEAYLDESDLNGFDNDVSGTVSWRFADRWNLTVREAYAIYQNSIRFNESVGPGQEVALGFRNQEIRANRTGLLLSHGLSPRDSLSLSLGYNSYEYPDEELATDRSIRSASLTYDHRLSERTRLGPRLSWVQQVHETAGGDDDTSFYSLEATLEHRFSPTFRIEASAGPTLVDSSPVTEFEARQFGVSFRPVTLNGVPATLPFAIDANTCADHPDPDIGRLADRRFGPPCQPLADATNPFLTEQEQRILSGLTARVDTVDEQGVLIDSSDASGTDLTYFAYLALIKDWENWSGRIAYDRSNSENAQFGSSSVVDTLSGSLSWRPRQLWTLAVNAAVSLQEQTGDQVVPIGFEVVNAPQPPGVTVPGGQLAQVQRIVASNESGAEEYLSQSVSFTVTRLLTRRSSAFVSIYWYGAERESDVSGLEDERWRQLVLWIGFDWKFDPIRF